MNVRHFNELPKAYNAIPKILKGLVIKPAKGPKTLPQVEYVVDALTIDSQHLAKYNEVCGFKNDGVVPAIYLAVLSQSLQMHMMTSEAFPFPILGLVHIRNTIKQSRKVNTNETITLSCKFGELKPHDKGVQFDFITTAKVGNDVVMEGLTTYLVRQKTDSKNDSKTKDEATPAYSPIGQWKVAENTGRRYAAASGDFNLIHIHALTAKAFGFKQAIAHGMWSKAKALANLELPAAYEADVSFKLPMFLPSTVEFLAEKIAKQQAFLIRNASSQKPHVAGTVKAI